MLRLAGCALILCASLGGSLFCIERFREQERELLMVKELLLILEKQLEYVRIPLDEMVSGMAESAGEPFEEPLLRFAKALLEHQTENVEELWRQIWRESRSGFCLDREEFGILLDMGRLLEPMDSKSQIAAIELYKSRADQRIQKMWEERGNKQKVYQSVCLLGGLILIIVLL